MSDRAASSGGSRLAKIALGVAARLYALGARLHRAVWQRVGSAGGRPACAIVAVGGLTVGGAGKTPVAAHLAKALADRGWRVVLASRGYKGTHRAPVSLVSDGRSVQASVAVAGDEALVLAAHAPGVPVLVGRDRRVVGHHAVAMFDAEIVVLDDAFQHHRLQRDIDIVCLDGPSGIGNGRVLPAGPLREPVASLARADWLCVVDGEPGDRASQALAEFRRTHAGSQPEIVRARRRAVAWVALDRSARRPLAELEGLSVGLIAGVARPGNLRRSLEVLGARVVAERVFPDHHSYRASDLADLDPRVETWITTEKDALKILPRWVTGPSLWVLQIEIEIEGEAAWLAEIEERLRRRGRLG